jgi:phospholipid/cholesterol/gamma-HCH transport system substrate-binding protein
MKQYFSKEIVIALVTLVSMGLFYFGLNYLKGANIFQPTNTYYVRIPNVNELQLSGPVYVDGFKVGLVSAIDYDFQNKGDIIVQISLDRKMKIETGSYAELKTSLTAGAFLNLKLNKYVGTHYQAGDTISGIAEQGIMDRVADNLLPQVESILPRIDSILIGIQLLVNHPALSQSLEQISTTAANLERSTHQLNTLLSNDIPPVLANINQISSDFTVVSSQLRQMDLNATLRKVDNTLQNLEQLTLKLNSNDNSLGLLLNDRSLYNHLDSTFMNASNLLLDFQQNPKRYVHFSLFGRR